VVVGKQVYGKVRHGIGEDDVGCWQRGALDGMWILGLVGWDQVMRGQGLSAKWTIGLKLVSWDVISCGTGGPVRRCMSIILPPPTVPPFLNIGNSFLHVLLTWKGRGVPLN